MDFTKYCGHIKDEEMNELVLSQQPFPIAKPACMSIASSSNKKERVVLTDLLVKLLGKWPHICQGTNDCTAFGSANAIHILKAFNCLKFNEEWKGLIATEITYAGSRCEIGNFRWKDGGASGSATAECCRKIGTLIRGVYDGLDLSIYSAKLADKLGDIGIPDSLEPIMHDHPVKTISLVTDTNTALDCLSNHYPITVASNRGFTGRVDRNGRLLRDNDGCLKAGSVWNHQMCVVSYDNNPKRPKVGIANSWPLDNMTGPLDGLPEGCFWIDMDDFRIMLEQSDSFVYSEYSGFPSKPLSWRF